MKKIFIVTLTFNTEEETNDCLSSLEEINKDKFLLQVVVIDNASKKPFISKKRKLPVKVIRNDENIGFTGGNNVGIQYALKNNADYILLLNNDTLLDKSAIETLFIYLENNNEVAAAVPKIYFAKGFEFHKSKYKKGELGKVIWYAGGNIDFKNVFIVHRGLDEIDARQYDTTSQVEFGTGCCMLVKRNIFEEIGLFDEKYFLYYEDADLSMRIKNAGQKIMYVPKSIIWHKNASSSGSGSNLHDYYLARNRLLFGFSYAPIKTKIFLLKESIQLLLNGRKWQKKGIVDYFIHKFGRGSFSI